MGLKTICRYFIKIGCAYKPFYILLMKSNMLRQILFVSFSLVTYSID